MNLFDAQLYSSLIKTVAERLSTAERIAPERIAQHRQIKMATINKMNTPN